MDDSPRAADGPRPPRPSAELPPGFVPLRLLLQPGGLCVEMSRPDTLVGRHSTADVRLCLPDISRRHCRFLFSDGHWEVFDLNSLNGVFVNGERLQQSVLRAGDAVRIGSLTFRVELADATQAFVPSQEGGARVGVLRKAS
jgi:pSer/pThr/pTyr-binding forkhead associated (FHA) protein